MWANNEVGTVQPVAEIARVAHEYGIPVHSDAVQALAHVPVDFADSDLDLMTITAHKVGGPHGVGALAVKRSMQVAPQSHGGGQERQIRSGTLDAPAIRGFAVAVEEAVRRQAEESARVTALRDRLITSALALDYGITVTGFWEAGDGIRRLPGNAHLLVPGCEGDSLLYLLDAAGVECSTGSACQAACRSPATCCWRWGSRSRMPGARFASPSGTPPLTRRRRLPDRSARCGGSGRRASGVAG